MFILLPIVVATTFALTQEPHGDFYGMHTTTPNWWQRRTTWKFDKSRLGARNLVLGDPDKTGKQTVLLVTEDGEKHPICDDGFTDLEAALICQKIDSLANQS